MSRTEESRNHKHMLSRQQTVPQIQRRPWAKRANSFPGFPGLSMITHMAADGKASDMVVISPHERVVQGSSFIRPDTKTGNEDISPLRAKFNRRALRVLVLVIVLVGQSIVSITLKQHGLISKDLHDIVAERLSPVAERVIPELQQKLELFENRMLDTLEMAKFMAPNFNETLFWRGMNTSFHKDGMARTPTTQKKLRPGFQLAQKYGATGQYPVVMVPGFVTSGLEVWKGQSCMENFFRERVWGGLSSAQYWLRERYCIMKNLALDPVTGGDPEGIKLRCAQGFGAADFFIGNDWMWGNYWVWSKILENLADLDYDATMMTMEAYDWRLGMQILEDRDKYFTHLKHRIEAYHESSGKKVILTSHSMGAIVVHYFFAWVTENVNRGGGGGGRNWVDEHIHAYVNIAGSHLGVPKAASALTFGEMSDTVFMGNVGNLIERFIPRKARKDMWNTWGSLWAMLPKGGNALWSVGADIPKVQTNSDEAFEKESNLPSRYHEALKTNLFVMSSNEDDGIIHESIGCEREKLLDPEAEPIVNSALQRFASRMEHTTQHVIDFLLEWGGGWGPTISPGKLYSFQQNPREKQTRRTWHDITQTPLPNAPNMKIYCLYGVGVDTERAYFYKRNTGEQGLFAAPDNSSYNDNNGIQTVADPPYVLDTSIEDADNGIVHGIKYTDGDGSVPLLSLGYMCAGPWRNKKSGMNPSGTQIITREYAHRTEFTAEDPFRKGPNSGEHVDILGNHEMMEDFMKIVSDLDLDSITDKFVSDIKGIVKRIEDHPNGGLPRPMRRGKPKDI